MDHSSAHPAGLPVDVPRPRRTWALGLAVLLAAATPCLAAEKRPIQETDILRFRWIADPQISPDGRQIAYVLVKVNEKEDRYETSVWTVSTWGGAPHLLTNGPRDSAPRFSPDSTKVAFLRAGEKEPPQIHVLPLSGGEGGKITDLPKGASAARWSPDSKTIVFTSSTTSEDLAEQKKPASEKEKKEDVRVVTSAHYRTNEDGVLDAKAHEHLWIVGADGAAPPRPLTSGRYDEEAPIFSRDGSKVYFLSDRVDEPYYRPPDSNVYAIPVSGGEMETVIDIDGPIFAVSPSPDGRSFAFSGFVNPSVQRSYNKPDAFLSRGGKAECLTQNYDGDLGSAVLGDQRPPRGGGGSPFVWTPDGAALIHSTTSHGRSNLVRIDVATRRVDPLTQGDHDLVSYTATPDASRFALTLSDTGHLTELYVLEAAKGKLVQLTHENDALFQGLELASTEKITYPSFDSRPIEAWVVKPPGFDARKKYPLILNIHGGPHAAYGETFFHEFQWMAAQGYVVLAPNPRGSSSYGEDFGNVIQFNYPGDDYKDLMAGVDLLVQKGYVDEKRLGVTGGSGGGLLTNWTLTQTGRFAAGVSQRSIGDFAAFWYATDFTLFTPFWFHKFPFQDPEEYRRRSPVSYVEKITTPLMLIEGEKDLRTPTDAGGGTMFRALKSLHKTAVMVLFPGETHDLSRSGKPSNRIARLRHIVNWFDKYLEGKPVSGYDPS